MFLLGSLHDIFRAAVAEWEQRNELRTVEEKGPGRTASSLSPCFGSEMMERRREMPTTSNTAESKYVRCHSVDSKIFWRSFSPDRDVLHLVSLVPWPTLVHSPSIRFTLHVALELARSYFWKLGCYCAIDVRVHYLRSTCCVGYRTVCHRQRYGSCSNGAADAAHPGPLGDTEVELFSVFFCWDRQSSTGSKTTFSNPGLERGEWGSYQGN